MFSARAVFRARARQHVRPRSIFCLSSHLKASYSSQSPSPGSASNFLGSHITDAEVNIARRYCSNLLQKFDTPSYTLQTFIPPSARDAYLSLRALNIELARIPDVVSTPTVGALRMQFWRDSISSVFSSSSSSPSNSTSPLPIKKEPVAILLHSALINLQHRHAALTTSTKTMKTWALKLINAREQYIDNRPYTSLSALETYAENTYSTLLYLTLAALPLHSLSIDHLASHIGKATGIAAVLRGLPLIAFPPAANHHSNNAAFGGAGGLPGARRQGAVLLPLDIMASSRVKEEEVFRQGGDAPGLKDAVFQVATRANDHLITAREMLKNLRSGQGAGHEFEHEGEEGHVYEPSSAKETSTQTQEMDRGFGVLMQAVPTQLWLERLEKADFDVFHPSLRVREWKLPWRAYWAHSRQTI